MMLRYIQALSLFSGTIIGVGVFALPYVISRAGFYWGVFELFILTGAILLVHLMYGDVAASLKTHHQLPGYAGHYLGDRWKRITVISSLFSFFGSLVVYAILGSSFLQHLMAPFGLGEYWMGFLIFFAIGIVLFYFDRSFASGIDTLLSILLVGAMALLITLGLRVGDFHFVSESDPSQFFLPYGVILFSLAGASVIPRVHEAVDRDGTRVFRSVLLWGTMAPAVLYLLFVISVLAASPEVSPDAISGLLPVLGDRAVWLGSLVGFLATITSFIGIGLALKSMLMEDIKVPKTGAWLVVAIFPFLLVALGVSDFVQIIGLVGAFAIGFEGMVIVLLWRSLKAPALLPAALRTPALFLFLLFLAGIFYEVVHFLK